MSLTRIRITLFLFIGLFHVVDRVEAGPYPKSLGRTEQDTGTLRECHDRKHPCDVKPHLDASRTLHFMAHTTSVDHIPTSSHRKSPATPPSRRSIPSYSLASSSQHLESGAFSTTSSSVHFSIQSSVSISQDSSSRLATSELPLWMTLFRPHS
ncbi:hypothetical protein C8R43DRAFT_1052392 [Mycena crocata]|nr:hypothetical protein C8R43DRAFT_1052392 [Mycena crocata]